MARIAVILTPGFADWEYGLLGGTGRAFFGLDVQYFARAAGSFQSQGGLCVKVDQDFEALQRFRPGCIAVIGGSIWETPHAPNITRLLQALHEDGAAVAGICGGTLALARAGLLDEVRHTSNDLPFLEGNAPHYKGAGHFDGAPHAQSCGGVITAPGTAPASFTAAVFEAAGVTPDAVAQFLAMMAADHGCG